MDINAFVANFAAQLEDTDHTSIMSQTIFRDIEEWNSLTALTIIAMVDDEYGVQLTGEDIRHSQTVEDIFNIVKSK